MSEQSQENPFAASAVAEALVDPAIEDTAQAEQIRREHVNREASVRGIGSLFYLGTLLWILISIFTAWSIFRQPIDGRPFAVKFMNFGMLGLTVLIAVVQGWVAHGLRALNGTVRLWAVVFSALMLINFPIGTVVSIYFIYVLVSAKGRFVMTPEYAAIRAATPHIRYKTPIWLWIVLGIFVLLLLFVIFLGF